MTKRLKREQFMPINERELKAGLVTSCGVEILIIKNNQICGYCELSGLDIFHKDNFCKMFSLPKKTEHLKHEKQINNEDVYCKSLLY